MAPSKTNEPLKEALINDVQLHPAIWDKRSKDYKDLSVKTNSWMEILFNLRATFSPDQLLAAKMTSVVEIKATWKNLRTVFNDKKKKQKGRSGAGNFIIFYSYFGCHLM
jgi:hypothetical protein